MTNPGRRVGGLIPGFTHMFASTCQQKIFWAQWYLQWLLFSLFLFFNRVNRKTWSWVFSVVFSRNSIHRKLFPYRHIDATHDTGQFPSSQGRFTPGRYDAASINLVGGLEHVLFSIIKTG